jgi:tetratricopeptide (TPR) repeat protein
MASVFLSYDHEDAALAKPLVLVLEKAGHTVWYDGNIHGGAQYSRKIEQALDEAEAVIVLWSPRSIESAWVRDEAAEGRDRGKLVPLCVEGVTPPMGFRQFQTLDLGAWSGRGKVPKSKELMKAIESQAGLPKAGKPIPSPIVATPKEHGRLQLGWLFPAAALALLVILGAGAWAWFGRGGLPVIEVAAANSSPRSQAAASDLFVKLGSLAQVGQGKWQLIDAASGSSKADLVFRTADTGSAGRPQANLVLLDGKGDALLWSREFSFPAGREADLRQQLSLTAGRVLACALESREAGGLARDRLKLFLNACALLAEASMEDPAEVAGILRLIVASNRNFVPAWSRLLTTDASLVDLARNGGGDGPGALQAMRSDIETVERIAPELPELTLARMRFLPSDAYGRRLELLAQAAAQDPSKSEIFAHQSSELQQVGRMVDAVQSARRAAELDPLSPSVTTNLIMTLAYSGQTDFARKELERAERLWMGTEALRDAVWSFHLRYGDPALAQRSSRVPSDGLTLYLQARSNPSPENVQKVVAHVRQYLKREVSPGSFGWAVQALGEFNQVDDVHFWVARAPAAMVAESAYLFFRPALRGLRQDPRFMTVAKRIGLLDYWRSSGHWPDFCSDPQLPYDCKSEAAKYG